ncbi:hypothetical protein N9O88_00720 [bacterium]|nr:hypothetical protein [bacterium]|tara:strand:+ start:1189 stop:1728 length:540 start_codon:yes stop_codon:yes gene_type:complete
MVKNFGGNKSKRIARKNILPNQSRILKLKNNNEECESYAAVIKLLGGSICEVICEDGIIRNCIIRNKFRGRSKRDNLICPNVWILVGLRDWECKNKNKKESCDLLSVYNDDEKSKLKNNNDCNWKNFSSAFPQETLESNNTNIGIDITDENDDSHEDSNQTNDLPIDLIDEDLIDIDEI